MSKRICTKCNQQKDGKLFYKGERECIKCSKQKNVKIKYVERIKYKTKGNCDICKLITLCRQLGESYNSKNKFECHGAIREIMKYIVNKGE